VRDDLNSFFSDSMSDFARILALCRARGTTIPNIGLGVIECKLPKPIVGIVIPLAQHRAKIRAKKGYFMRYPVLNGRDKLQNSRASVRPSDISRYLLVVPLGPRRLPQYEKATKDQDYVTRSIYLFLC
jgi:hypothetical protein